MTNALDLALANAAANAPKGEELHLENLDAIANPEREGVILHQYDPNRVVVPEPPQYNPKDVAFNQPLTTFQQQSFDYQLRMQEEYKEKVAASNATASSISHLSVLVQTVKDDVRHIINMIQDAKQSMPSEPNHKHRSLHEWDDSTLLNELVERENDLMPFYYELLKRIGSPELQSLVMSSMQGKNASMVTLAQLCSALGSMSAPQPQVQQRPVDHTLADIYKQLENSLPPHDKFSRQHREDAIALVEQYKLPIEQRDALSDHDFKAYQSFMNELLHRATFMERIPNREQPIAEAEHQRPEQMSSLERQHFAQQMNTVIPKSPYFETPPTYNSFFKER